MVRYLPNALALLIFCAVFVLYFYTAKPLLHYPDVPWHIQAGDLILEMGAIPEKDPWSYTAGDYEWFGISWLYDVVLSVAHSAFGMEFLFYFMIGCGALTVMMVYLNCYNRNVSVEATVITIVLVSWSLLSMLPARPQLISYILIPVFHGILHYARDKQTPLVFFLPVLMAMWVNMHGAFLAAFVIMGCYVVEFYIAKDWARLRKYMLIGIACGLAVFVNPWGVFIVEGIIRVLDSTMKSYITEWHPTVLAGSMGWGIYFIVFCFITNIKNPNIPMADKLLAYGWMVMGLDSNRHFPLFVLIAAPYIAMSLHAFKQTQEKSKFADMLREPKYRFSALALASVFLAAFVLLSQGVLARSSDIIELAEDAPEKELADAVDFVMNNNYGNLRLFNVYGHGGRIIYLSDGKLKVFCDGRVETAYPKEILEDYLTLFLMQEDWESIITKYNLQMFILAKKFAITEKMLAMPGWEQVWDGKDIVVYVKEEFVGAKYFAEEEAS